MESKKSTILLTVVAVATLMVAVVGASFAFFAVQASNDAKVEVTATTAEGSDIFKATGSGTLELDVTNAVMMQGNAGQNVVAASDTDSSMKVSLTAGDGTATCTYDLVWDETSATAYKISATAEAKGYSKEFTLEGSSAAGAVAEINVDAIASNGVLGNYTIANTAGSAETVQTWTFTAKFYNLDADQAVQMNKTYTGNITVDNVQCTNA